MADTAPAPAPLPWWVVPGIAYTLVLAFIAVVMVIVLRSEDKYEQIVLVALISLVTGAAGYYFGSSSGSERKDSTIAGTAAALATSAPVMTSLSEPSDAAKATDAKLAAANA